MEQQPHISVCIPTSPMGGNGANFLKHSFDILLTQSFKDFDVVISDNCTDDLIRKVCDEYANRLTIHYFKNESGNDLCNNTNNVLKHATGSILKILFLDDFLYGENSLQILSDNFDLTNDHWLVTACTHTSDGSTFLHTHTPSYDSHIHYGRNTIGTPSIMAVKNENLVFFDTNFKWALNDCYYYKQNFDRFGLPKIIPETTVVIRLHENSITNTIATANIRIEEFNRMLKTRQETIFSHPKIFATFLKLYIRKIKSLLK